MLTQSEIQKTVQMDNLILRNLKVTQGYYELSEGMKRVVGNRNANWCSFATHASKTAGYAIRSEVLPPTMTRMLIRFGGYQGAVSQLGYYLENPVARINQTSQSLVQEIITHISQHVSDGNIKVFKELAGPFSAFIDWFAADTRYDRGKLRAFLSQFKPGPAEEDGQDFLCEAFTAYTKARYETEAKKRVELIYLGNVYVGLHEQTRLQPQIAGALGAPVQVILEKRLSELMGSLFNFGGTSLNLRQRVMAICHKMMAQVTTNTVMFISLPSGRLVLGQNVQAPFGQPKFPAELATIENPVLGRLMQTYDKGLDTLTGSAAADWSSLEDRMSFIIDLFRSHQQNLRLFTPPFSLAQTAFIRTDRVPAGQL